VSLTITTGPEDLRGCPSLNPDEGDLLGRLRAGDEEAFACLVDRHHAAMVRLARGYVRSPAVAEEVAQDAWLGLLRGLDSFEGRSSLRTWLFRIVVNRAISTGLQERQHLPVRRAPEADPHHRRGHRPDPRGGPGPGRPRGSHGPLPPLAARPGC